MKKILVILSFLLFAGFVGAYEVGQVVTQDQVNNQDFSTHDMNFSIESLDVNKETGYVILRVGYTTLEKQTDINGVESGKYKIIRLIRPQKYRLQKYYDCRLGNLNNTKPECLLNIKNNFVHNIKAFRKYERLRLDKYKTNFVNEIIGSDILVSASDFE